MATIDFREVLSTPVEQIEQPRSIPRCHLLARIPNPGYEFGTTRGQGTPYVRFVFKDLEPGPDVEPGALDGIDLSSRDMRVDMWCTAKALYRLDRMMDSVLGPNTNKRTCFERLPDMNDKLVMIGVSPRLDEEGRDTGFNEVTSVSARPE